MLEVVLFQFHETLLELIVDIVHEERDEEIEHTFYIVFFDDCKSIYETEQISVILARDCYNRITNKKQFTQKKMKQ